MISWLPFSASVFLSKAWLCVTLCPAQHHKLGPFTTVSDNLEDRISIHPQAYASLSPHPQPTHLSWWHEQDGVIDLSEASCQRVAFGNQTILLSCSRQHFPWSGIRPAIIFISNSRDRIARNVMLCPWQPRRGGLKSNVFEVAFSALSSKWSALKHTASTVI